MVKGNSFKRVVAALMAMAIVIGSLLSIEPMEVRAATNEYFTGTKEGSHATTEPTMYYKKTMVDSSSGSNVLYWAKDTHPSLKYTPPLKSSTGLSAKLSNGKIGHSGSWGNGLWLASRPSMDELFNKFNINKDNYENAQFTNFGMATSDKIGMRCSGYGGNTWFHNGLARMEVYIDVYKVEQVNDTKQLITFRMYANDGAGRGQTSEGYFQVKVDVANELAIDVSFHKRLSETATDGKTTEDILGNKFDISQDKSGYGFQIFKLNKAGIEALDKGVPHDMDEDGNLKPADYTKIFDYIEKSIFDGNGSISGRPNPNPAYFTKKFDISTGSDGYTDPIALDTSRSDIYLAIEHSTPEGVSRGWNNLNDLKQVGTEKLYFYQIFTVIGTKQEDLKVYYKDANGKLFTDSGASGEEADASLHITDQPILTDFKVKKIFKDAAYNTYGHKWADFSYLLADNKEFKNAKVILMTDEMTTIGPVFSNQNYYIKENPEAKAVVDGVGFKANPQVYHFETKTSGEVYYSLNSKDNLTAKNATDAENREYIAVEFGGIINEPKTGKAKIIKSSADESIAKGNNCYSLEGAVFELTHVSSGRVYKLTTDKAGLAETDVYVGEYKVKETKAPLGFLLNTDIPNVTVKENSTAEIKVANEPGYDDFGLSIFKKDDKTNKDKPQGNASLLGAEFTVKYFDNYEGKIDGEPKKTWVLSTDEKGQIIGFNSSTINEELSDEPYLNAKGEISLPLGTYEIKESKAPAGYLPSNKESVQVLRVDESMKKITLFNEIEVPETVIVGDLHIEKFDIELEKNEAQGDANFENIKLDIINRSRNSVKLSKDGKEISVGDVVDTISLDAKGHGDFKGLPIGSYEVVEVDANTKVGGYLSKGQLTRNFDMVDLNGDGIGDTVILNKVDTTILNNVARGGVKLAKWDLETNTDEPLGVATFDKTEITIRNISEKAVLVEGKIYEPNAVVKTVITDGEGKYQSESALLPFGTYEYEEINAPKGYLPIGVLKGQFEVRTEGQIVNLDTSEKAIKNQVVRGDFDLIKIAGATQERLANVPFEIKSLSTDEAHVFMTDENGYASTANEWSPHDQNTNVGEASTDGIWFGVTSSGVVAKVDNALGALPYDNYVLTELACDANKDKVLIPPIHFTISRNGVTVNGGTISNEDRIVTVETEFLTDEERSHEAIASGNQKFIDYVTVTGVEVEKKYVLEAKLMLKGQSKDDEDIELIIDEKNVTGRLEFTADSVKMERLEVPFEFDTTLLAGKKIVAFEKLFEVVVVDGKEELVEIGSHEDINDMGQTIIFKENPEITLTPTPTDTPKEDTPTEETKVSSSPKTGDNAQVFLFLLISTVSMAILVAMAFKKK